MCKITQLFWLLCYLPHAGGTSCVRAHLQSKRGPDTKGSDPDWCEIHKRLTASTPDISYVWVKSKFHESVQKICVRYLRGRGTWHLRHLWLKTNLFTPRKEFFFSFWNLFISSSDRFSGEVDARYWIGHVLRTAHCPQILLNILWPKVPAKGATESGETETVLTSAVNTQQRNLTASLRALFSAQNFAFAVVSFSWKTFKSSARDNIDLVEQV